MKITVCKTYKEAVHCCDSKEKVVPYGSVWAVIKKDDYFKFMNLIVK